MDWKTFNEQITPKCIGDIVYADAEVKQTIADIASGAKPFPQSGKNGILLYGVPGTGKSALAGLLPDAMELGRGGSTSYQRLYRIAPGNNGAGMIQQIEQQAQLMPFASHHYFVLDEVDNLTTSAMFSLKTTMNMPNTVFVMTTNYLNKVENGVKNRCVLIPFNAAPAQNWLDVARTVLNFGQVTGVGNQALLNIITTCKGSARDIIDAMIDFTIKWRRMRGLPV